MALEENSQGGPQVLARNLRPGDWLCGGVLGRVREIALIGPAVTVALKAQAFSPGFYLIVPGSLSRTRIPLRRLIAFSRQARGRELSVSLPFKHTQGTFPFACFYRFYRLILIRSGNNLSGNARNSRKKLKCSTKHFWLRWRSWCKRRCNNG